MKPGHHITLVNDKTVTLSDETVSRMYEFNSPSCSPVIHTSDELFALRLR